MVLDFAITGIRSGDPNCLVTTSLGANPRDYEVTEIHQPGHYLFDWRVADRQPTSVSIPLIKQEW
jgi:hypothetical protein